MAHNASVVICAHTMRRLEVTSECIRAVLGQLRSADELLVVVDHEPELARRLERIDHPAMRVLPNEGEPGLSAARNTGVQHARGSIVVFIDDDAIPRDGWLAAMTAPFERREVLVTGGWAVAAWDSPRPGWFPDEFLWVVGCSYRGLAADGRVRNVIGCTMAVRADVFRRAGAFSTEIGRIGSHPLGCEETELCIRASRVIPEGQVLAVGAAVVDHHVTPERTRWRYFASRCYHEGISKALVTRMASGEAVSSELTYATRTLPAGFVRALAGGRFRRAAAIVLGLTLTTLGYVVGTARFGRRPALEAA